MSLSEIVSRDEWLAARKELLARGEGAHPAAGRAERGRAQAADGRDRHPVCVRGPGRPCSTCSTAAASCCSTSCSTRAGTTAARAARRVDEISTLLPISTRDTTLVVVPRAPLAKIEAYKAARAGRSRGTRRTAATSTTTSTSRSTSRSRRSSTTTGQGRARGGRPGLGGSGRREARATAASCATATASSTRTRCYARGAESLGGSYYFLDLTASAARRNGRSPRAASQTPARGRPTSPTDPTVAEPGVLGRDQ